MLLLLLSPYLGAKVRAGLEDRQKRNVAEHLRAVTKASADYARKHQMALLGATSHASGPSTSIAGLIADGLLPLGFSHENIWRQGYEIHFRQPEPSSLQAVVLTVMGHAQSDRDARFMNTIVPDTALLAGGAAGFVPTGLLPGQSPNMLVGAGGGWVVDLGALGIASPGPGHLGSLATFDSSALGQDFLYRVAVPGHPELNAMFTELDMRDHAIRNISELQFQQRTFGSEACSPEEQGKLFLDREQGLYLCRNDVLEMVGDTGNSVPLKQAMIVRNGEFIDKPICAPGTDAVPQIFTAPAIAAAGPDSPSINSIQTWATNVDDAQWQAHMRILTHDATVAGADSEGWVYPTDDYGLIMTFAVCARVTPPVTP
jgi:hypothetical protein